MNLAILAGMAFAAAVGLAANDIPLHETTVQHAEKPMAVTYHATQSVTMREINIPASRPGFGTCRWAATVQVERQVRSGGNAPVDALAKPVGAPTRFDGAVPGLCGAARANIEAQVASRIQKMQGALVAVAKADHPALTAELQSVAMLAGASVG